ncbi:disease resistance protein RGA2-like [Triticum dicoccoides]|uniref:disease resistance protein RGA2-like n=1 Tax=Triticum dicoccoides TaxID=85692 RepID=UPI001891502A|nr:disease resistance protein RGA2-like [Triticum dicoccoides]XP_037455140.1 disease resistance protein RGA2-like [Triticum dicoccoides]
MDTAIGAAKWVLGKALAPVTDGLLEAWAASANLDHNIDALKMELLYAHGMLENAQGRGVRGVALKELLRKLEQLAYGADDVLDELEYFRIHDALHGTYHAADVNAVGSVHAIRINAEHTARHVTSKLLGAPSHGGDQESDPSDHQESDPGEHQENDGKQRCLSGIRLCGRRGISSSSPTPANKGGVKKVDGRCMPKVISSARNAAHTFGKHFPCYSPISAHHDNPQAHVTVQTKNDDPQAIMPELANHSDCEELKFNRVQMSQMMMDMVVQLKEVCAKVSIILNLNLLGSNCTHTKEIAINRSKTTSEIVEPDFYGRDDQKKKIVDVINSHEYSFSQLNVLPIFGIGGIGKTTFTQHICQEMSSYFQASIWVCVSLDFSADRLAQEIVNKIAKVDGEKKNASAEELIQQRLKGKRFLLVLDDMWTYREDEWKKLIAPLKKVGSKGNFIIVTTRIPMVAEMVKTTNCELELERLDDADTMRFFEACVFGNELEPWGKHPAALHETGHEVVHHLKGSPLATKTVGRLLRNQLTLDHWKRVLESKEWELETSESDIMPALKLSYDFLPFHLKQLFVYCALFPEDYEFDTKELVQLWIGLGILHPFDQNRRTEDVGLDHLHELVNYGFFKKNKKEDGRYFYVVHDLLHELATKVSSDECVSICSSNVRSIHISPSVHHLSIIVDDKDVDDRMTFGDYKDDLSALGKRLKVENLRTLMVFGRYHGSFTKTFAHLFKKAKALRTIFLSGASYSIEDILHNFSETIHLRYLRIEPSDDRCNIDLPSMLFRFYHLEIINFEKWNDPVSIKHITNLVKLRHFIVPENMPQVHSDISEVGKLKLLSELRRFQVRNDCTGFEISQLTQLTELGGSLGIYNLEKVPKKGGRDKEIRPIHRNHLRELTLEWDVERSNREPTREENVIENLVPHSDLRDLCITGHGGTSCPRWLGDNLLVKNLESLHLANVSWKTFPPLGEFWSVHEPHGECKGCIASPSFQKNCLKKQGFQNLKRLVFVKIPKLKRWAGNQNCGFFLHLEVVIIEDCPELIELPFSCSTCSQPEQEGENMTWFPRLRKLRIVGCPKLRTMPAIPWTDSLCSIEIEQTGSIEELTYSEPKLSLDIYAADGTSSLFPKELAFCNLSALKILNLHNCPPLPLDKIQMLTSLRELTISGRSSIVLSPVGGEGHVLCQVPVENLTIYGSGASGKELTQLLSHFPKLTGLAIYDCEKITELGVSERQSGAQQQETKEEEEIVATAEGGLLLLPTQLQKLIVENCHELRIVPNLGGDNNEAAGGLQRLHSLRQVRAGCPKLLFSYSGSSSSSCFPFPASLEKLCLSNLKEFNNLALTNLSNLEELELWGMEDLTNLSVSRSSKLHTLSIYNSPGVLPVSICSLISTSLTKLSIYGCKEVEPIPGEALLVLTSLQELAFGYCQKLQFLPAGLHTLASINYLCIFECTSLQSLPKDCLPSCLQRLQISNCPELELLPTFSDGLRTSLQKLEIANCPAIKSVPKDALPSSLQELLIRECPEIKSLHKDGLPKSLRALHVRDSESEELKRQCRSLIGTIPVIMA